MVKFQPLDKNWIVFVVKQKNGSFYAELKTFKNRQIFRTIENSNLQIIVTAFNEKLRRLNKQTGRDVPLLNCQLVVDSFNTQKKKWGRYAMSNFTQH